MKRCGRFSANGRAKTTAPVGSNIQRGLFRRVPGRFCYPTHPCHPFVTVRAHSESAPQALRRSPVIFPFLMVLEMERGRNFLQEGFHAFKTRHHSPSSPRLVDVCSASSARSNSADNSVPYRRLPGCFPNPFLKVLEGGRGELLARSSPRIHVSCAPAYREAVRDRPPARRSRREFPPSDGRR